MTDKNIPNIPNIEETKYAVAVAVPPPSNNTPLLEHSTTKTQYPIIKDNLPIEFIRKYAFSIQKCYKFKQIFCLIKDNNNKWIFHKYDINKKFFLDINSNTNSSLMLNILKKLGVHSRKYHIILNDGDNNILTNINLNTLDECIRWYFQTEEILTKVSVMN